MTVEELIEKLKKMPRKAVVYVETEEAAENLDHVYLDEDGDIRIVGDHVL